MGEVWWVEGKGGEGETDAFPSLTPTPEPSRHYFIVLTEMKKEMMAAQGQAGKMWVARKLPAALTEALGQHNFCICEA